MPVPEKVKQQLLLKHALRHHRQRFLGPLVRAQQRAKEIVYNHVPLQELKQNQISAFTRLVMRTIEPQEIGKFLDTQKERREAWANVSQVIKDYVCTELTRDAEQIARWVQARLGQPLATNQQPSSQLVQKAWGALAVEFASYFDGWYRIEIKRREEGRNV